MKTETKISLLALISSVIIFSWKKYKNSEHKLLEETRAVTKLNIMELMSNHPKGRLSQKELFSSYTEKYGGDTAKKEREFYNLIISRLKLSWQATLLSPQSRAFLCLNSSLTTTSQFHI